MSHHDAQNAHYLPAVLSVLSLQQTTSNTTAIRITTARRIAMRVDSALTAGMHAPRG